MSNKHLFESAKRKAKNNELDAYSWEVIGSDAILVTMGIPRILQKGKNKGKKTWDGKFQEVVTKAEMLEERNRYEKETGLCGECLGETKVFLGWNHIDGLSYKGCGRCFGTGKREELATNTPSEVSDAN